MNIPFESLLSPLRDQAIGALIGAFLSITISVIENRKRRRELSYEVISDRETWQNGHIVRIIALRLWNSGNEIIEIGHFFNPITFTFGYDAIVNNISEEDKRPTNILLSWHIEMNKVELQPFFLKCKETFTLAFSLQKFQNISIDIRGNIESLDVAVLGAKLRTTVTKLYIITAVCILIWIVCLVLKYKFIGIEIFSILAIASVIITTALITGIILIHARRYQLIVNNNNSTQKQPSKPLKHRPISKQP